LTDTQFFNSFHCNLYKSKRSYSTQVDSCPFHYFGRLVSGKARIVSEQKELRLQEGDIFFIPRVFATVLTGTARIAAWNFTPLVFP
jgi:hypothetical protein